MPKQIEIESIQEFLFDGSPNLATKMPALGPMYGNDQRNFLILLLITLHSGKTKTKLKYKNFGLDKIFFQVFTLTVFSFLPRKTILLY